MRSLVRSSALAVCLPLLLLAAAFAGTPQTFTVQGVLRDGTGSIVPNGNYALILSGWTDSTGGALLWTENKNASTTNGLFQVTLDGAAPVSLLSKSGQQYVQVQVSGQAPLSPRMALSSVPTALLSTRMDGDVVTRPNQISVGSGDPDFDLLRIKTDSAAPSISMGGDPDFDLLRISATPKSSSITMTGDPDFDLLRIKADTTKATISMGGDPDFDLLRITGGPSGSSMEMKGDPDFDLLRITAVDSTAKMTLTGDPDFDLLRITADPHSSSISMTGDPDFDLLRITANDTAASIKMTGDPDFDLLRITAGSSVGSIAIGDPGVNGMTLSNDVDGDGAAGPAGIAIDEPGVQRVRLSGGGGAARLHLNGLPPGNPVGGLITADADSDGASIAVNEDGTHNITMTADSGSSSIAVNEEGTHNLTITSDGTGDRIVFKDQGAQAASLSVAKGGKRTFNLFDSFPCGAATMELSNDALMFRCTPGGSLPDTAVYLDRDGNLRLDGDVTVGGDICASGTIGACSDARYKTDVATLTDALEQLSRIRGVNFTWRQDEFPDKHFHSGRDLGFIAQELKEVVPQVVTLGKDGYYSVDYGRLTPLLVEAVKELEGRLAAVEQARQAELASLTDRLAALELQMAKLAATTPSTEPAAVLANAK